MSKVDIQFPTLRESSGLCRSAIRTRAGVYWSHNDSGNTTELFAFGDTGKPLGRFPLSVKATDPEDCSSALVLNASIKNVPTIILGDFGDNGLNRSTYKILVVTEPTTWSPQTLQARTISFQYPDKKKRNCEACYLEPDGRICLVTKSNPAGSGPTKMFTIRSWLSGDSSTTVTEGVKLPASYGVVTSMDRRGNLVAILGFVGTPPKATNYATIIKNNAWLKPYKIIKLPSSPQPEAICFDAGSTTFHFTTEIGTSKGLTPFHTILL